MNENIIKWLLEDNEPSIQSIRYRTLTELLDYPGSYEDVK